MCRRTRWSRGTRRARSRGGRRKAASAGTRRLESNGCAAAVEARRPEAELLLLGRICPATPPPPGGDVARQRPPEPVAIRQPAEKLGVDGALAWIAEVAGIRMGDTLDQAVLA